MPIDTRPIERLLSGLCPPLRARRIAQRLLSASLLDTTRLREEILTHHPRNLKK